MVAAILDVRFEFNLICLFLCIIHSIRNPLESPPKIIPRSSRIENIFGIFRVYLHTYFTDFERITIQALIMIYKLSYIE